MQYFVGCNFIKGSVAPIHEVVGANVTRYSDVTDVELVNQLGPENLDRTNVDNSDDTTPSAANSSLPGIHLSLLLI